MKTAELKRITLTGDLAFRAGRNYTRLELPMYRPDDIFDSDQLGWPGDWEGRTLLALCLHENLSGRKAAYLDSILEELDAHWNERGYLREIYPDGIINEQQISGHNWLLRALIELYLARKDEKFLSQATQIVENLYLPLIGCFSSYPIVPESRTHEGGAAGHNTGQITNGWQLSSDIGCAFGCFDGLAQYYQLLGGDSLKGLLDEMFEAFSSIDVVKCSVQVHATLTALRGILRYYEASSQPYLLAFAERFFKLYLQVGITENYANYNWFGRPAWTEPCAIIDSYMAAVKLFRLTKKPEYIAVANKIYYNALLAAQRFNGGFGCDMCSGTEESDVYLQVKEDLYEAYWCCTMRGAEGLASAARNSVLWDDDALYITNYVSGEFHLGEITVTIKSRYPYENNVSIYLHGNPGGRKLYLYLPKNAQIDRLTHNKAIGYRQKEFFIEFDAESEMQIALEFSTLIENRALIGFHSVQKGYVQWKGDLIIGTNNNGTECFLCDRIYGQNENEMKTAIIRGIA